MLDFLNRIDTELFLILNGYHHPLADQIFFLISAKYIWIPFYAVLLFFLYKKEKKNLVYILLIIALMIFISDQLASAVIKPLAMRLRPCHEPGINAIIVNDYCGGMYGFVSSHAANTFALVTFLSFFFISKGERWLLFCWASLVSFSRVYLGVHYPGDILGGALVGVFSAYLCISFYRLLIKKINVEKLK